MEQRKRNTQIVTIVIIVIALLTIGVLIGYMVTGKISATKPVPEIKVEVEQKISDLEKERFMTMIGVYNEKFADYYSLTDMSKIPNQQLLKFALFNQLNGYFDNTITAEQIEKYLHKYFGNQMNITHENVRCGMFHEDGQDAMFIYNPTTKTYSFNENHPGHGGGFSGFANIETFYLSGSKKDNTYTVKVKLLYGDRIGGDIVPIECLPKAYYKNQEEAKNETNPLIGNPPAIGTDVCEQPYPVQITPEDYARVKDQIPTTTFTFIKDSDGNYGLSKVTIK